MGNGVEANISSALDGQFSVSGNGTLILSDDQADVEGLTVTGEDITVQNEDVLGGPVSVNDGAAFSSTGTLNGSVTANSSTLDLSGTSQGITATGSNLTLNGTSGEVSATDSAVTLTGTSAAIIADRSTLTLSGTTGAITAEGGEATLGGAAGLNTGTDNITIRGTVEDGDAIATIDGETSTNAISVSGIEDSGTVYSGQLTINSAVDADGNPSGVDADGGLSVGEYGTVNLNAQLSDSDDGETVAATISENGTLNIGRDGSLVGTVENAGTLVNAGNISGTLTNNGTVRATGSFGDVENTATNRFEVEQTTDVSGNFDNSGIVVSSEDDNVGLRVTGTFTNQDGGLVEGTGAGRLVLEAETIELQNGSAISGNVRLRGTIENESELDFDISQRLDGALDNRNSLTVDVDVNALGNDVDNQSVLGVPGTITVEADGRLRRIDQYVNAGTTRVEANNSSVGLLEANTITNTGDLFVDGRVEGEVINEAQLDLNREIRGTLRNTGTATLAGEVTNDVFVTGAGLATVDGDLLVGGDVNITNTANPADNARLRIIESRLTATDLTNSGDVFIDSDGTLEAGGVVNNGMMISEGQINAALVNNGMMISEGQINGAVVNNDQLDIQGGLSGSIENDGLTTITGNLNVTGAVDNDDDFRVDGGDLTISELFDNDGTVTVGNTRTLTANGTFENDSDGILLSGGTIVGDIDNAGRAELSNSITGDLLTIEDGETNFVGTLDLEGRLGGDGGRVNVQVGTTTVDSISYGGTLTVDEGTNLISRNAAEDANTGGTFNINGNFSSSQFVNDGDVNVVGTFSSSQIRNEGDVNVTGTIDGALDNNSRLEMAGGRITGTVDSLGSIAIVDDPLSADPDISQIDGLISLEREGGRTGRLDVDAVLIGNVENSGIVDITNELRGNVRSENQGVTDITSSGVLAGSLVNNGASRANIDGQVTGNITNSQNATTRLRGTLDGSLANTGRVLARGSIGGDVTNSRAGDVDGVFDLTGDLVVNGDLSSSGRVSVSDGDLTVTTIANSGTFEVFLDDTVTVTGSGSPSFVNSGALGSVINDGTIIANVRNEAPSQFTSSREVRGDLTNLGAASLSGLVTGQLQSSGSVTTSAPLDVQDGVSNSGLFSIGSGMDTTQFTNTASGTVSLDGTLRSSLTNDGAFSTMTGSRIVGDIDNSGVFALSDAGTLRIDGNVNNSSDPNRTGRFSAADNGSIGDLIEINGDLNGGQFALDLDLQTREEGASTLNAADRVVVTGDVSGTVNLVFDLTDNPVGPQDNILVFDVQDGQTDFDFTASGLPSAGEAIIYALGRGEGGDLFISDQVNPAIGAIAGNITLTQSLIGSIVNRPSSPFVIGLAYDDEDSCGLGGWTRALGGTAEVDGTTKTDNIELESTLSASYSGIQFGGDYACFNGFYNGWDLAFGGIGGVNVGETSQPVFALDLTGTRQLRDQQTSENEVDFRQTYFGVYVTANRGPLSADLQYRIERTDFEISNEARGGSASLGLDQEFESRAQTLSGSASYFVPIGETGFGFIPTAGFALTRTETDKIEFDSGTLEIQDSQSNVGFVGATLSKSQFAENGLSAINYFGTATVYSDFADDPESLFKRVDEDGNDVVDKSTSSNLGTYGEVSVGANYIRILDPGQLANARQFNASVRADARFSEDVESYGLTAQVRLQF